MSTEKFHHGICKQVNHGDSIVIREVATKGLPTSKTIGITNITCPRLLFKNQVDNASTSTDDRFAWEAREFLRKQLIGREVVYTETRMPKGGIFGDVYIGRVPKLETNVAFIMVSEGFASVRKINNPEVAAKTQNYQQLIAAEETAKTSQKGMWDSNSSVVGRNVCWTLDNPNMLLSRFENKSVRGIVEYVRDGCSMQVCLLPPNDSPDQTYYHVMVLLAGIRTPGFKMEGGKLTPEPLAEEAKTFVEARILQREVTVHLFSVSGQSFVGSLIHPNGDICEFLLSEGLARCVEWSIGQVNNAEAYRAKESKAKNARKGLWVSFKPPAPPTEAELAVNKLRRANIGAMFAGNIVEVGLGDNVVVKCDDGGRRKFFLSSVRPVRLSMAALGPEQKQPQLPKGAKPLYDIPYMFEAREFLRKHIGKKVEVHVDYTLPKPEGSNLDDRICATVQVFGGPNLAEALLSRGLAQVVRYRKNSSDPRAKNYDALVAAEDQATEKALGWHSKSAPPVHKVQEISGNTSKAMLPSLQRSGRMSGIVEFVPSGSRLKIFVPKDNTIITLLLGGVICFKNSRVLPDGKVEAGEKFGDEAAELTRDLVMQRNVDFEVEGVDRVGNFIGTVYASQAYSVAGPVKGDMKAMMGKGKTVTKVLNAILVLKGYAYVHRSFAATKGKNFSLFSKCEAEATGAEVACWSCPEFVKMWKAENSNGVGEDNANGENGVDHDSENVESAARKSAAADRKRTPADDTADLKKRINSGKKVHLLTVSVLDSDSNAVRLYLQQSSDSSKLQDIINDLNTKPPSLAQCNAFKPQRGQLCAAKFSSDGMWYRAQVLNVQGGSQVTVLYVDFGNEEVHNIAKTKGTIGPLPNELATMPLITKPYRLMGVCLPPDTNDRLAVGDYITELIGEDEIIMTSESSGPVPCGKEDKRPVPLACVFWACRGSEKAGSSAGGDVKTEDIAEKLLKEGLVYRELTRLPADVMSRYETAQEAAKKARRLIWRYGDCRPDD